MSTSKKYIVKKTIAYLNQTSIVFLKSTSNVHIYFSFFWKLKQNTILEIQARPAQLNRKLTNNEYNRIWLIVLLKKKKKKIKVWLLCNSRFHNSLI